MEFVGAGQKPAIFSGVFTSESVGHALTTLETSSLAILLDQALDLDARITAELLHKAQHDALVGLIELPIAESNECCLNPSLAILLGVDAKLHRGCAFEESVYLFKRLDV